MNRACRPISLLFGAACAALLGASDSADAANPVTYVAPSGVTPYDGVSMVADPLRQRVVLTGGAVADEGVPPQSTWEWDGQRWTDMAIATPPGTRGMGMAFDSLRSRIVLTGDFGTTWALQNGAWRVISRGGLWVRTGFMAYDAARDRMVLVGGGFTPSPADASGVWEFDGTGWAFILTPTPVPGGPIVYDPVSGGVVLVERAFAPQESRTFIWNGSRWNALSGTNLPGRYGVAMAWDPFDQSLKLFGGFPGCACGYHTDQWKRTPTGWAQTLSCTPVTGRTHGASVFDPVLGRLLVRGGLRDCTGCGNTGPDQDSATVLLSPTATEVRLQVDRLFQVTEYSGMVARAKSGTVELLHAYLDQCPNPRLGPSVYGPAGWVVTAADPFISTPMGFASDPGSDTCFVLTGGGLMASATSNDAFALISPPIPEPRQRTAIAFDAARGTVVAFGGDDGSALSPKTWLWNGSAWSSPTVTGPPPRFGHGMCYDPARQRVVVSGGHGATGADLTDTWEWDGAQWQLRSAVGPVLYKLHYDASRSLVTAFGRSGAQSGLFGWDGSSWTLMVPILAPPVDSPLSAYEGNTDRYRSVATSRGTWTLDLTPDAPVVVQHPRSHVGLVGAAVNLDALAVGQSDLSYQWRRNGQPLSVNERIPAVHLARLTITSLEPGDEGVYDAVAVDSTGTSTTATAWLVVLARCPSDFTGDARVDTNDLTLFLSAFGQSGPSVATFDLNADGVVNTPDLVRFLGDFGRSGECE